MSISFDPKPIYSSTPQVSTRDAEEKNMAEFIQQVFDKNQINIQINHIKQIPSTRQVFEVNHSWIVRLFSPDRKDIQREAFILKRLKEVHPDLPIPEYQVLSDEDATLALSAKLPGEPLSDMIYQSLSPVEKKTLAVDIVSALCRIHQTSSLKDSLPKESGEILGGKMPRVPSPYLLNDRMQKYLASGEYADLLPLWNKVYCIYMQTIDDPSFMAPIHNDLHQGNLLIDVKARKLSGILDFEDVVYGHISRELRHLYSIDSKLMIEVASLYAKKRGFGEKLFIQSAFAFRLFREYTNLWKAIEFPEIACAGDKESATVLRRFLASEDVKWVNDIKLQHSLAEVG